MKRLTPSQKKRTEGAILFGRGVLSFLAIIVLVFGVTFILTPAPLDIERGSYLILVGFGMERLGRLLWPVGKPLTEKRGRE